MKNLKWGIILMAFSLFFGIISYAEETKDESGYGFEADKISFHAEINDVEAKERKFLLGLYEEDGKKAIDFKLIRTMDWEKSFNAEFTVPEYEMGKAFLIRLMEEDGTIEYNGNEGNEALLQTYVYTDETGNAACQTAFYVSITPAERKNVKITLDKNEIKDGYFLLGEDVYVSEDFIKELRIGIEKEDDSYILKSGTMNLEMRFTKGESKATIGEEELSFGYPLMVLEDKAYFPLYEVGIYFACYYMDESTENEKIISLDYSYYAPLSGKERLINTLDIESKTDYLIWITKDDHTVNVFTGKKGFWHLYKSYPCALGAPNSPTVEGEFEYEEFIERWNYATYYCGPVIRFYRGYALHSTLIKYNGTLYDDRVGVDISHGCIRLHPEDINHLAKIIPLDTKIYITK